MKLKSFQVTNYRCIDDSGVVSVEPDVTCLVGRNGASDKTVRDVTENCRTLRFDSFGFEEE